jgi:hypothetical protein
MKYFILTAISYSAFAADVLYRQNYFKGTSVISSRSITFNSELLKQSYDLKGNLKIEIYSNGKTNEAVCIAPDGKKISANNEEYFNCLSEYTTLIKSSNGESEGKPREIKNNLDLDFKDRGKNLNLGKNK